ncbi:MAG: PQQ-binding-like beta-propeller repeat protein [Anaerolineales bacterium]|nr:PQQ-binding-like beta-propeller repeat protein [Anaerolineales bacterium]
MGAVYRAQDLRFKVEKIVAVKEMINQATDPDIQATIVETFEREANILATVSHPSIPTIYDYFTLGVRSYLVMEFIEGDNLEIKLQQHRAPFQDEEAIGWAIALCDVLDYLHTHEPEPIIFRDVKPANIMITRRNQIRLVDFGIAKTFQPDSKGTMIGTEGYSPPEQYRGEASPQVDIYALGATLHHLLTNQDPRTEPPFTFEERPIRSANPSVSVALESIINTALNYNPQDRFENAAIMRKALISLAQQTGLLEDEISIAQATQFFQDQSHSPVWTFTCEDEIRGTASYLDGVLYVGSYDHNLYALEASNGKFIWKYPAEGGIVSKPAIHDNKVYFGSADQYVHAISCRNGKKVWVQSTDGPIYSSPAIAEGHLFIGSDDEYMHVMNIQAGREAWRVNLGSRVRSSPLVVADMVYVGSENGEIQCYDFSGNIKWRTAAKRAVTASPHYNDNVIYITSLDAVLYAIDAKSGWVIWRYRMENGSISTPITDEKNIYVGSTDNTFYCVNIKTSNKVWSFDTDNQINSSPFIYKGAVYFCNIDGMVYSLHAPSGRLRWKYQTEGQITGSPIIVDDVLYIGSSDNKVYALPA